MNVNNIVEIIRGTQAQDAIDKIAQHLIDPMWKKEYPFLTQEQKNTLVVNEIYRQFPGGVRKVQVVIKNAVKEIVRNW